MRSASVSLPGSRVSPAKTITRKPLFRSSVLGLDREGEWVLGSGGVLGCRREPLCGDCRLRIGCDGAVASVVLGGVQGLVGTGEQSALISSSNRIAAVNRLHDVLQDLLPGGASTRLTASKAMEILAGVEVATAVQRTRKLIDRACS